MEVQKILGKVHPAQLKRREHLIDQKQPAVNWMVDSKVLRDQLEKHWTEAYYAVDHMRSEEGCCKGFDGVNKMVDSKVLRVQLEKHWMEAYHTVDHMNWEEGCCRGFDEAGMSASHFRMALHEQQ